LGARWRRLLNGPSRIADGIGGGTGGQHGSVTIAARGGGARPAASMPSRIALGRHHAR
jgi:hypothetical protein